MLLNGLRVGAIGVLGILLAPSVAWSQSADQLSEATARYVEVGDPSVALTHLTVIDGTGAPAATDQTVVIENGRITAIGPSGTVRIAEDIPVRDMSGHTMIPGMVGMHNHMFYTSAGGRASQANYTAPRLYLASGVTTIRTTGSRRPYDDINVRSDINDGRTPGPRIHVTAPYITGDGATQMARITSPEQARTFVAYWASEGATWIKAYTGISEEDLGAAIDEAHKHGLKVTGHICSVSFREAVALGIDNIEHGFNTASDIVEDKQPSTCPPNLMIVSGQADPRGEVASDVIRTMVNAGVGMTSTLAVIEPFIPNRPTRDSLTLEVMAPETREDYLETREQIDNNPNFPITEAILKNTMEFELAFVEAGGLLAAGVDPTGVGGAIAGFGDQRNYQLLLEAGFTPEQTVQIMSLNGAKILGVDDDLGSVEVGKIADLAIMEGDLVADPSAIRRVN
ncbi:MAG: amidohydrolase family protein, partial [Acidimicrobiia bacterium]|nr:amidohydrolase family protein [Acidimicrobiia bacterium]